MSWYDLVQTASEVAGPIVGDCYVGQRHAVYGISVNSATVVGISSVSTNGECVRPQPLNREALAYLQITAGQRDRLTCKGRIEVDQIIAGTTAGCTFARHRSRCGVHVGRGNRLAQSAQAIAAIRHVCGAVDCDRVTRSRGNETIT